MAKKQSTPANGRTSHASSRHAAQSKAPLSLDPLDDTAMALSQAAGTLDVLLTALEDEGAKFVIPDATDGAPLQALYTVLSEIRRAAALVASFHGAAMAGGDRDVNCGAQASYGARAKAVRSE